MNFRFVLSVYADPENADTDDSRSISPKEALSLATALSLDGAAAGFGAALGQFAKPAAVFFASLIIGAGAVFGGFFLGNLTAARLRSRYHGCPELSLSRWHSGRFCNRNIYLSFSATAFQFTT